MEKLFVFGKTVSGDTFTDREKETTKLVSNFTYGVNTFIVSPRRWGKTSLVKKVKGITENQSFKVVYLDVQRCRSKEEFCERFASAVLTQTSNKMEEWMENAKNFLNRFSIGVNAFPDPMSIKWRYPPSFATTYNGDHTALPLRDRTVTYDQYAPVRPLVERLSDHHSPSSHRWFLIRN